MRGLHEQVELALQPLDPVRIASGPIVSAGTRIERN
jgi:hypothetical protein